MRQFKFLTIIILTIFFCACGSSTKSKKSDFSISTNASQNKKSKVFSIAKDQTLELDIKNPKALNVTATSFTIDGSPVNRTVNLKDFKLGNHSIKAIVNHDNETQTVTYDLVILNDVPPKVYTFNIINEYPHDITSYTQGLEFHNGELFESTGQYGESKLRKVNYKTGEVLKNIDLSKNYFGEGLSILNNNVYQLTWKEGVGFIYDANSFEKTGSFKYGKSKEGWGLCNDGSRLFKSDGTEKIWQLNTTTLEEQSHIEVYTNKSRIVGINEMEWVNGKIYANRYQLDGVAIINPENGAIDGVIDFRALKKKVTQHEGLDVLNGIAYNPETKTLFVTGKRWDKLFEVEIVEK
ncbi:MAG: glutaminyl-peptide cyclotransferase [Flavobacteriaceae bacterium]|nr:glutaminyl-peptide cyclotransferase [Flavobacteriaceae bacterium]